MSGNAVASAAAPRLSRRALTRIARARALDLAAEAGVQLADTINGVAPALAVLRERAMDRGGDSARVRAMGFEFLPDRTYLQFCADQMLAGLTGSPMRRWRCDELRGFATEVRLSLERVIELSSLTDVSGELGLPFEVVVTAQTGARSGLSALAALRSALDNYESGQLDPAYEHAPAEPADRSARWLVRTASRVLPAVARGRYQEEFSSELRDLAEAGVNRLGQLGYAARLASRAWSLRASLPAPQADAAATDRTTIRATSRSHAAATDRLAPRPPDKRRGAVTRWFRRQESRLLARRGVRSINRQWRRSDPADGGLAATIHEARRRGPKHRSGR